MSTRNRVILTEVSLRLAMRTRCSCPASAGEASLPVELGRPLVSALLLLLLVVGVTRALFFIRVVRTEGAEPNVTTQEVTQDRTAAH